MTLATQSSTNQKKPRHLNRLPVKNKLRAPGDVIGGLILLSDKEEGIESGHVGMSIDSKPYRQWVGEQIQQLQKRDITVGEMQDKFDEIMQALKDGTYHNQEFVDAYQSCIAKKDHASLKELLIDIMLFDKKHEQKPIDNTKILIDWEAEDVATRLQYAIGKVSYINTGMGGLLLNDYMPKNIGYTDKINSIASKGNDVYMVKQDYKTSLIGRPIKSTKGIARTKTAGMIEKKAATVGYHAATKVLRAFHTSSKTAAKIFGEKAGKVVKQGYVRVWKWGDSLYNNTATVNYKSIKETLANKMGDIRGFKSQEIDIVEGTLEDNRFFKHHYKAAIISKWNPNLIKLKDIMSGVDHDIKSKKRKAKFLAEKRIRKHKKHKKEDAEGDDQGDMLNPDYTNLLCEMERTDNKGHVELKTYGVGNEKKYISNTQVKNVGEVLISLIVSGDRDAIGKEGQNKALVRRDDGFYELFAFDYGKAYQGKNRALATLKDDFTFEAPDSNIIGLDRRFSNFSMLYDNPLRDKMKGIYLIAAFRGRYNNDDKKYSPAEFTLKQAELKAIIDSYRHSDPPDEEFAKKLEQANLQAGKDILEIDKLIHEFEARIIEDPGSKSEYKHYIKKLNTFKAKVTLADELALGVFEKRLSLTADQIDIVENMEKLTSEDVQTLSEDDTVYLQHIQVPRETRVEWQLEKTQENPALYKLVSKPPRRGMLDVLALRTFAIDMGLQSRTPKMPNGEFEIIDLTVADLSKIHGYLTEKKIAEIRDLNDYYPLMIEKDYQMQSQPQPQPQPHAKDLPEEQSVPARSRAIVSKPAINKVLPEPVVTQRKSLMANKSQTSQEVYDGLDKAKDKSPQVSNLQHNSASKQVHFDLTIKSMKNVPSTNVHNKNELTKKVPIKVEQTLDQGVLYSTTEELQSDEFYQMALELARVALLTAKPGAVFNPDPTNAYTLEQRQKVTRALQAAIDEAVADHRFTPKNTPRVESKRPGQKINLQG